MQRSRIAPALRAAALLVAGALALHELRYLIDAGAGATAWAAGHSYLTVAGPLLAVLASAIAAGSILAGALGAGRPRPSPVLADRAAALAASLLAVHLVQEGAEALLSGAGAGAVLLSLAAACAYAIPLAALIGLLLAALGRLLDGAERALACALAAGISIARGARSARRDEVFSTPTWIARGRAAAPRAPPSPASA